MKAIAVCLRGVLFGLGLLGAVGLQAAPLNLNTADAVELAETLKGVGIKKAEAIIAHREAHGPFKSVDELAAVKGIGESIVLENRDLLTVGEAAAMGAGKAGKNTK